MRYSNHRPTNRTSARLDWRRMQLHEIQEALEPKVLTKDLVSRAYDNLMELVTDAIPSGVETALTRQDRDDELYEIVDHLVGKLLSALATRFKGPLTASTALPASQQSRIAAREIDLNEVTMIIEVNLSALKPKPRVKEQMRRQIFDLVESYPSTYAGSPKGIGDILFGFSTERSAKRCFNQIRRLFDAKNYGNLFDQAVQIYPYSRKKKSMPTARFWGLISEIGNNANNIERVVPASDLEAFADKFFGFASKIAKKVSNLMGETRDRHDYSAFGVVAHGQTTYQEIMTMLNDDPENAAYYVVEEFDGDDFGGVLGDLAY